MRAIIHTALICSMAAAAFAAEPPLPEDVKAVERCIAGQQAKKQTSRDCIDAVSGPCLAREENYTTVGMHGCISRALAVWDGMLNEYYARARTLLDEDGRTKLRDVQRAWIVYRDRLCELERMPAEGGTLAGILQGSCILEQTAERALGLRTFVETLSDR